MLLVLAFLVLALSQVLIAVLVFLQSQHNKKIEQRIFSGLAVFLTFWTIANTLLISSTTSGSQTHTSYYDVINRIAFFLAGLLLVGIYWFSLQYPTKYRIGSIQKTVLIFGGVLTILGPTTWMAGKFIPRGNHLSYHYGSLSIILGLMALMVVGGMYVRQSRLLRHTHEEQLKRQSITLLVGMTFTMLHAVLCIIVLPAMFGQKEVFFAVGYAGPFYLVAATGYGMLRQGLFNVRTIVVRSFIYVVVLGGFSILYAVVAVLITTHVSHLKIPPSSLILLIIMALIVALLFQPLRNYFNRLTNRLFFRDYYDAQDVLDEVSGELVGTIDVGKIRERISNILTESLHPSYISFVLHSETGHPLLGLSKLTQKAIITADDPLFKQHLKLKTYMQQEDIELAVRLRTPHEELGYLLLGARRSGVPYGNSDMRVIGIIADELAIGLQNALRFQEIQKFNRTLQQRIQDATSKLRTTNQRLRTLDETKDEFISMASHQLRTPLTSVKGYLSMVLEGDAGKLNKQQQELLTQSFISSQRMVYLIADLLNLSRLNTGKFVIESIPVDLREVVQGEIDQLTETAKSRGLTLVYDNPSSFPMLMLDETKIHQVVMNFIDNAIYYTPSGGTITITLRDMPTAIEYRVSDNGIGVPKTEQHHLFSKFYRAGNARRARPDGTGLGLFMAKKVIAAQGGSIIFESEEGKGSTFGFRFTKARHLAPAGETPKKIA